MTPHSEIAKPAISIIVPVYNVEDFLAAALRSIVAQVFIHPFEIILVDDCSTDSSKSICEDFARRHPEKIKLYCHSENQGISVARNTGLAALSGTYFTFVDPDDLLPSHALQTLYDAAIAYNADIVKGNHLIFDDAGYRPAKSNTTQVEIYQDDEILSAFFAHKKVNGFTWGKLFLSETFAHIPNRPGVKMKQDTLYCAELFSLARKLVVIDKNIYHYRLRNTGITAQKFHTENYLWWLYSIEHAGHFGRTPNHQTHYKALQIDVLLQLACEAQQLDHGQLPKVLKEIAQRQHLWHITSIPALLRAGANTQTLIKFLLLSRTLNLLQKRLKIPLAINS